MNTDPARPVIVHPVVAQRVVTLSLSNGPSASPPSANAASQPTPESVAAAVLFREILKPLARGLGPVGEIAAGSVADSLFLRDRR